jgi:hypothetical protein
MDQIILFGGRKWEERKSPVSKIGLYQVEFIALSHV